MSRVDRVEVQLGKIVLAYDEKSPIKTRISPAETPVHASVLESVATLTRLIAFRKVHPDLSQGMIGIESDNRIRRELINLRKMGESDTANEVVGYYQKLQ